MFSTKKFKAWARKRVILVEIDFPHATHMPKSVRVQNERLKTQYGVKGFPTIYLIDADERRLSRDLANPGPFNWTGRTTPTREERWIANAERNLK